MRKPHNTGQSANKNISPRGGRWLNRKSACHQAWDLHLIPRIHIKVRCVGHTCIPSAGWSPAAAWPASQPNDCHVPLSSERHFPRTQVSTGERTHSSKCLLGDHGGLSSDPQRPCERPGMVALRGVETGRSLELAYQPV